MIYRKLLNILTRTIHKFIFNFTAEGAEVAEKNILIYEVRMTIYELKA